MDSDAFENLISILEDLGAPFLLPEDWILCTDLDLLRDHSSNGDAPQMATQSKGRNSTPGEILLSTSVVSESCSYY